jgi:hypothetical protein
LAARDTERRGHDRANHDPLKKRVGNSEARAEGEIELFGISNTLNPSISAQLLTANSPRLRVLVSTIGRLSGVVKR